jgi:hypothetical protein
MYKLLGGSHRFGEMYSLYLYYVSEKLFQIMCVSHKDIHILHPYFMPLKSAYMYGG